MEQKKDLAKIALAALIFASASPMAVQADSNFEVGTFLAAGCGAHGCKSVADNSPNKDMYNTHNNSYKMNTQPSEQGMTQSYSNPNYPNSMKNATDSGSSPSNYPEGMPAPNHEFRSAPEYNYQRSNATSSLNQTLTEAQLLGMLNPQARGLYLSLDPEGKALAIQLASQDSYQDKNLAIKEAQRRMNDRRGQINR